MGHAEAEAEYDKPKGLIESLHRSCEAAGKVSLQQAELNLKANKGNLDALSNLERNLRSVRAGILADLKGIIQTFGNEPNRSTR